MITVDGLTVEFGGTTLFKDISFQINEKDRRRKNRVRGNLPGVRPSPRDAGGD